MRNLTFTVRGRSIVLREHWNSRPDLPIRPFEEHFRFGTLIPDSEQPYAEQPDSEQPDSEQPHAEQEQNMKNPQMDCRGSEASACTPLADPDSAGDTQVGSGYLKRAARNQRTAAVFPAGNLFGPALSSVFVADALATDDTAAAGGEK